jgi:hypothetical protein
MISQVGLKEAGDEELGVPVAAAFLGITPSTLYKLMDPDQGGDISFTRVCQISERYGVTAAAEHLSDCVGLIATPGEVADDVENVARLMSRLTKGEGDLLSTFLEAWGDLHFDDGEKASMDAKLSEIIKCALTLRRALKAVPKAAVVIPIKGQVA